jgi:TolA-binding protein
MASVASAAYWTVRVHTRAARQATADRAQTVAAKMTPRHSSSAPSVAPSGVAPEPAPPPPAPPAPVLALADSPSAPAPVPSVPISVRAPAAASLDPEALLSGANEARRARHADEAIRDYRALQARFPTSREAVLSHLSLGNLYLAQGAFADAVAQFQAYIHGREAAQSSAAARGDGTALAEEALLGEARALAALGRADDERAVWRTLETRFPRSEYLWRARQRLHELDRGVTP